jgi:hypothetical protein
MHSETLFITCALIFSPYIQAQVLPQAEADISQAAASIPHTMNIQYSKFSRTTCMSNGGPVLTSEPGQCIKLQDADHGIMVYPNVFHGQCKCKSAFDLS